jgi:predicted metal-dependent hydrolase
MDARLRAGIDFFNHRQFFQSHEVLEELYQDTEAANKPFVEALVQVAAAFRLFSDFGEVRGPVRMIYQALIRFENYPPDFLQVRVQELSALLESWAKKAEQKDAPPVDSIPKIPVKRTGLFS